jgi:copper ion binding protein
MPMKKCIVLFTLVIAVSAFSAEKIKTVTLSVSGMTCQSCVNTVEKALKKVEGVKEAKADLKKNRVTVSYASATITSAMLVEAVSNAGFSASEGTTAPKTEMKKHDKSVKEDCKDGCCGDDDAKSMKHSKMKKTESKKS